MSGLNRESEKGVLCYHYQHAGPCNMAMKGGIMVVVENAPDVDRVIVNTLGVSRHEQRGKGR
jgi:hypothetical protein